MMKRYFRFLENLHNNRDEGTIRTPEEVRKNYKEGHLNPKPESPKKWLLFMGIVSLLTIGTTWYFMNVHVPYREPKADEVVNIISVDLPRGGSCTAVKDVSKSSSSYGGGSTRSRVIKRGVISQMNGSATSTTLRDADPLGKGGSTTGIQAMLAGGSGRLKRGGGGVSRANKSSGAIGFGGGSGSGFSGSSACFSSSGIDISKLTGRNSSDATTIRRRSALKKAEIKMEKKSLKRIPKKPTMKSAAPNTPHNTEELAHIKENSFMDPLTDPLSTVSIDVDNASYTFLRSLLHSGRYPAKNSIRVEEAINYFTYDYPKPQGLIPFSVTTEVGESPWNPQAKLLHIGLKGQEIIGKDVPRSNLVFLLDVSGSMSSNNKLPLLQRALPLLVNQLSREDKVSIVVYAGAAGVVLPSTSGADKNRILSAISDLHAGGSTAGGAGIKLAYKIAEENFIKDGNNRIILATDGDFNVGTSSTSDLVEMMKEKREKGIALTVLGLGMGNYKDDRMEQIADKGNGNYYYIDNMEEAKKVLVTEMVSTLHTIAKDVKLQIEFNPQRVKQYRLIGYVNRKMATQDFDDDTKDAGELGAGHTVTALYEIIPQKGTPDGQKLKYQKVALTNESSELGTVKLRYKRPQGTKSAKIEFPIEDNNRNFASCSNNYRFSAAVAEFILKVNGSKQTNSSWDTIKERAIAAKGADEFGYRKEFISLIDLAKENEGKQQQWSSTGSNGFGGGSGGGFTSGNGAGIHIDNLSGSNSQPVYGGRSQGSIRRTVRNNMASLKYAYNKHLKQNPKMGGKMTVKFAIDQFGNVLHCRVMKSTIGDSTFEKETIRKIRSWAFGKIAIPGDVTEVTYPFVFTQ